MAVLSERTDLVTSDSRSTRDRTIIFYDFFCYQVGNRPKIRHECQANVLTIKSGVGYSIY
jgi:hypothetical protein